MLKVLKKHGIIIVAVFFILVIAGLCFIGMQSLGKYQKAIEDRDYHILELENALYEIGDLQDSYVVNTNVRAGEEITADKISTVSVPVKIGMNLVTSSDDLIGKYFRVSLTSGTVLTKDDIIEKKLDNSARYYDVYLNEIPLGLEEGDYIDIRISFPLGDDFLAISHKQVVELNSGIAKLELTEAEIYTYRSMLVDSAIYSAKLYALQYIDAGAQTNGEVYYPLNENLQELYAINPNITKIAEAKIALERKTLENANGGWIDERSEAELNAINNAINSLRNEISNSMRSAQQAIDQRIQAERQAAANGY